MQGALKDATKCWRSSSVRTSNSRSSASPSGPCQRIIYTPESMPALMQAILLALGIALAPTICRRIGLDRRIDRAAWFAAGAFQAWQHGRAAGSFPRKKNAANARSAAGLRPALRPEENRLCRLHADFHAPLSAWHWRSARPAEVTDETNRSHGISKAGCPPDASGGVCTSRGRAAGPSPPRFDIPEPSHP